MSLDRAPRRCAQAGRRKAPPLAPRVAGASAIARPRRWLLGPLGACLVLLALPSAATAATFTVSSLADSGPNTLRAAITAANAATGTTNTIAFTTSGPIKLTSGALPAFTNPVNISGPSGGITLDGNGSIGNGLEFGSGSDGSNVSGNIAIGDFSGDGIVLNGSNNDVLTGLRVGTDLTGTSAMPNGGGGIFVTGSAFNNTIGGPGAGNVISGNGGFGIGVSGALVSNTNIEGNFIGTNAGGTAPLGNGADGILVTDAVNTIIGTGSASGANVISGNSAFGIEINSNAMFSSVQSNFIGTDATGSFAIPNGRGGSGGGMLISNTGFQPADGNVISGNIGPGVTLDDANQTNFTGDFIGTNLAGTAGIPNTQAGVLLLGTSTGNEFYAGFIGFNGGPGISTNGMDNSFTQSPIWANLGGGILGAPGTPPTITGVTQVDPSHLLFDFSASGPAGDEFESDFFLSPSNLGPPEGETFLGSYTFKFGASGTGTFQVTLPGVLGSGAVSMTTTPLSPVSGGTTAFSGFFPAPPPPVTGSNLTFIGSPLFTPAPGALTAGDLSQQAQAGTIALLKQLHPSWSVEELRALISSTNPSETVAPGTLTITPAGGGNATINPFTISGSGFPSTPFAPGAGIPFGGAPPTSSPIPETLEFNFSGDATPGKFIYVKVNGLLDQTGFPSSSATGGFFLSSPEPQGETFHRPGSPLPAHGSAARSKGKRLHLLELTGKVLVPAPAGVVNQLLPGVGDPNAIAGVAMALVRVTGAPKGFIEGSPALSLPAPKHRHEKQTGTCADYKGARSFTKAPEQDSVCGGLDWLPASYEPKTSSFTYTFTKHLPPGHYRAYFLAYTALGLGNPAIDEVKGVQHAAYAQASLVCTATAHC